MNPNELGGLKTHSQFHQVGIDEAGTIPPFTKRAIVAASIGAVTIAVGDAALCPGHTMCVIVPDVTTGSNSTVVTLTGVKGGNLTLDADGDRTVVWSDGIEWHVLQSTIA